MVKLTIIKSRFLFQDKCLKIRLKKRKDLGKMNVSHSQKHHNLAGEHTVTDIGQLILFIIFVAVIILDLFVLKFSSNIIGILSRVIAIPLFLLFFITGSYSIFISHKIIFGKTGKETGVVKVVCLTK